MGAPKAPPVATSRTGQAICCMYVVTREVTRRHDGLPNSGDYPIGTAYYRRLQSGVSAQGTVDHGDSR